ncbi:hypothetical protein A3J15_02085 [Candidatus Roizmanbacteria bacterium RIFCSPLOWO2_02_FULL_38_10]|uniref:S1 motif domain-containing protein n=1 Tax=Candidatus Roizmanbacteria bacterium RIFCSPLOWO2_02_FULL_38_10 TaxID=1802074 RepID=A0A1F7JNS2_9BACT|nr:MAG: hypothetical protein A3J15_02085 [Candidatus Roizmanbacteria bacterium RIFCSPLOWO2_02_FULL_38_10]
MAKKLKKDTSTISETPDPISKEPKVKKSTSMEQLLQMSQVLPPRKGDQVKAKVISINRKQVLFDIGWKSYAVLGEYETKELATFLPYLKVGDTVAAKVVVEEAKEGYPVLSLRKFVEKGKWEILEEKQKKEEEIEVICGDFGRGGIFIDFMGIRGVIPKIQLTESYINEPTKLYNQKIKVKLLEVDKSKNRLVVSQKAAALGISYIKLKEKFDQIKIGEKYTAKVIGFSDFGVFCEVDGIEGLIHISEISWSKIMDPSKILKVGQEVDVIVVEKNSENYKLNLSMKRLTPDPWIGVEEKYPKDKQFEGELIRKEKYGFIIRLTEGIEGLIHVSKIAGSENLEIGAKVSVYIEKVDVKNRRISLILVSKEKPVVYR